MNRSARKFVDNQKYPFHSLCLYFCTGGWWWQIAIHGIICSQQVLSSLEMNIFFLAVLEQGWNSKNTFSFYLIDSYLFKCDLVPNPFFNLCSPSRRDTLYHTGIYFSLRFLLVWVQSKTPSGGSQTEWRDEVTPSCDIIGSHRNHALAAGSNFPISKVE